MNTYSEDIVREVTQIRVDLLKDAYEDEGLQAALYDRAKEDISFYFNYFLWTYNPQKAPYNFPFVLWPKQEEVVKAVSDDIDDGKGTLCEKSRKQGATYIYLGVFLHKWTFAESFESLLLSLKEDEVDDPTPSSLFGKLRYMGRRLPFWLMPKGFKWERHGDRFLRFINPENGNSIVGRATTPDAGRGGRKTAVLIDEHAALTNRIAEGLEMGLRHTTDSLHRLSTPRGINLFKKIRDKRSCRVITFHWTQNPTQCRGLYYFKDRKRVACEDLPYNKRSPNGFLLKNDKATKYKLRSEYYDKEVEDAVHERNVAQELDIHYVGSGYCRFSGAMLESKSERVRDGKRGRLEVVGGQVIFVEVPEGEEFEVEIWQFPTEPYFVNRSFVGGDTAEGKEHGDFDSGDVIVKNIQGDKAVHAAALHGHWTPDVFADKLDLLGRYYDAGAYMIVERNKDGFGTLLRLRKVRKYSNLYIEPEWIQIKDPAKRAQKIDDYLGFNMTKARKHTITGDLDEALRVEELITESLNHYTEMSTFENHDGKLGATGSNNDDRVISLSLAWYIASQAGRPKARTERRQRTKSILRSRSNTSRY